jgi:Putative glycosyl/glycerophosphate transferases involved in teichoic acid biosynthesis TagF/TagB/EpsJ/RodC
MGIDRIFEIARDADKRLQRWRKSGRAVLVNARTPMNYTIVRPILDAVKSDERITFYFTASEQPSLAREIYSEAGVDARLISPLRAALMKFDAYITADLLWVKLPRGTRRIFTFHGVAGKYGHVYDSPDSSMRDWDRLFFINRRRMRNFISSGAIDPESAAARLVGYPKLDCLVDGSLNRDEVLCSLGIDPQRQTVLYAPTWSPYSSLNNMGVELVERLCAAGYAVIVKLHDRSRDSALIHSGGVDWVSRLEPVLARGAGHLASRSDASLYLAAADVLITDHSSVGFEYLLLDRPLIRIEVPELIAATNIHPDYVSLMAEASTTVQTVEQALCAVHSRLSEPLDQSVSRKAVADELFYRPGTATVRAVRELYEVLELDPVAELSASEMIKSRPVES